MTIEFAVFKGSPSGEITESHTILKDLGPDEVLLEHTHSGVCGTDAHHLHEDIVLGHEGVGVARAVGDNVKSLKVGDRLGFGYVKGGCGYCSQCLAGFTWHCETGGLRSFGSTDKNQGSFATHSVWPESRLVHIPDAISNEDAAPFMCAGQTVFVPLFRNNLKPTDRVGVVGIGGLGHLAIQFAAAWGCEVVVFSGSDSKKQEALEFGAKEFYNTKKLTASDLPKKLDHLIVTTSVQPDWDFYANLMAAFGHIYALTIADGTMNFPYLPLVVKELSIHGSCSSSFTELNKMMSFIVAHNIKPKIQKFPMTAAGITDAFQKLEKGEMRYRGVLEM